GPRRHLETTRHHRMGIRARGNPWFPARGGCAGPSPAPPITSSRSIQIVLRPLRAALRDVPPLRLTGMTAGVPFDQYHEPPAELPEETRTFARICTSLIEEAEAIGWYEQRMALERDDE